MNSMKSVDISSIEKILDGVMVEPDFSDKVKNIKQPVLLIAGMSDKITPVKYSEDLLASLERGKLVEVDGADHFYPVVKREKTERVVEDNLDYLLN